MDAERKWGLEEKKVEHKENIWEIGYLWMGESTPILSAPHCYTHEIKMKQKHVLHNVYVILFTN